MSPAREEIERARRALNAALASLRLRVEGFSVLRARGRGPFVLLVGAVLSQNTSDKNSSRALENLIDAGLTSPEALAATPLEEIARLIEPAGLHNVRASNLKDLSVRLAVNARLLEEVCVEEVDKARRSLMELPGVGRKTADIYLLFHCRRPVMPVDRHIVRITMRLLGRRASYDETSELWARASDYRVTEVEEAHLGLIEVGRRFCRPRDPHCTNCPLRSYCEYALRGSARRRGIGRERRRSVGADRHE
ncbi:MAG: hypothetical protein QW405_03060 [Fervidicoccaceae archaeon]